MKNIKNQKGAISLFVVLSMLFFLAFMLGVFSITTRRNAAQVEAIRETAKIYSSGLSADNVYDSIIPTTGISNLAIPISTIGQLEKIKEIIDSGTGTANYSINGKSYQYTKDGNYYLANDIILDMNTELDGKENITIYDYMLYDTKYKINMNNHNIYYKLSDNTLWKCIFYQDIGTNKDNSDNRFSGADDAGKSFSADKYSILTSGIEEFKYKWRENKYYEFLLTYSCNSGKFTNTKYNRWLQTNNPMKEQKSDTTDGAAVADGYEGIVTTLGTGNYWGGLNLSTASSTCLLDGSVGHGNWFYAVGVYKNKWYNTYGIPTSSAAGDSARECILFIRAK